MVKLIEFPLHVKLLHTEIGPNKGGTSMFTSSLMSATHEGWHARIGRAAMGYETWDQGDSQQNNLAFLFFLMLRVPVVYILP